MKILHILDHSLPLQSGYVYRSQGLLGAQRARGWETAHVTSPKHYGAQADIETFDGFTFYRTDAQQMLAGKPRGLRETAQMWHLYHRILEVAADVHPDVLHAHSPALCGLPALYAARKLNLPLVYEIRAFWEDAAVDLGTSQAGGLRYRATKAMETYLCRRANHVIAICDGLKDDLVRRGIDRNKINIVPNAVDPSAFDDTLELDHSVKTSLGTTENFTLGFVGSFYHYEGLDLLLEALPLIHKNIPHAKILLVGGGPQEAQLKAQAYALGIESQVIFTGRVPHQEVRSYYDAIDLLVYPRKSIRLTELVTPLKPLEAMADQQIFIASDVGGHKEIIPEKLQDFCLFPADDVEQLAKQVKKLYDSKTEWAAHRKTGLNYVQTERTWSAVSQVHGEIYTHVTEQMPHVISQVGTLNES